MARNSARARSVASRSRAREHGGDQIRPPVVLQRHRNAGARLCRPRTPHTELTTIIVTPGAATAWSTSAVVRSSRTPRRVSSARIGAIKGSG